MGDSEKGAVGSKGVAEFGAAAVSKRAADGVAVVVAVGNGVGRRRMRPRMMRKSPRSASPGPVPAGWTRR